MASSWTDDRMDGLKGQVDALSHRTDDGFRDLRGEMNDLRKAMASRFDRMDARFEARFDAMDARFDAMQRVLIVFGASMFAAMMSIVATLIAFQL